MFARLISCEMKKLFGSTFFRTILILFLTANVILCVWSTKERTSRASDVIYRGYADEVLEIYKSDPDRYYSEYERIMDEEKTDPKESFYGRGEVSDRLIFSKVDEIIHADEDYHYKIDTLVMQSKRLMKNYESMGKPLDSFTYRYNKQLADVYTRVGDAVKIDAEPLKGWREFFTYETDFYLLLILVAICCISIATNDRRNGFYSVSGVCRYGRRETVLAKYVTLIIVVAMLVVLFALSSFLSVMFVCGYSSPLNYVQAVSEMSVFPFAVNMMGATGLICLLRFLAMSTFALALFAFSTWIKNQVLCFGGALIVFAINYFVYSLKSFEVGQWKHINLLSLYFIDEYMVAYRAMPLFDYSLNLTYILIGFMVLIFTVVPFIAVVGYTSRRVSRIFSVLDISGLIKKICGRRRGGRLVILKPRGMFSFECYKHRVVLIVLAVLLIGKVYDARDYYKYPGRSSDKIYKEYIEVIAGDFTEEKADYIKERIAYYNNINSQYDSMYAKYENGEITREEYSRYINEYLVSDPRLRVLRELSKKADQLRKLEKNKGIVGQFVYETGYAVEEERGCDLLLLLAVAFISCRIYLYENEKSISGTPMDVVNRTTKRGRLPLYLRKVTLSVVTSVILAVIFGGVDMFFLLKNYEMPDMSATILSLNEYARLSNMTILEYSILREVLGLIGTVIISLMCFAVAACVKRMILTYAIVAAGIVVPHFAASTNSILFSKIDTALLQYPDQLFRVTGNDSPMARVAIFFVVFAMICTGLIVLSVRRVKKGV